MKKSLFLFFGLLFTLISFGQTLQVQGGVSVSNLDWRYEGIEGVSIYNENLIATSFFAGVNYMDKHYFNLSSNIGFIRKGGKDEFLISDVNGDLTNEMVIEKPTLDYLTINTLFEAKYTIKDKFAPFVSFGPRFDYLLSSSRHFDGLQDLNGMNNTAFGLLLGGGVKYYLSAFQIGLRADYYLNFNNVGDWYVTNPNVSGEVKSNAYTVNLTLGYRLK